MPVLSNILLATDGDDRLKLSATNREIAITCWIGARVDDAGAITIPAKLLTEFVNSLPDAQITMDLAVRTQTLGLKCGKFNANIKGIDAYEFPLIPALHDADGEIAQRLIDIPPIALVPGDLSTMIDRVTFAASSDENRPTLTGVLMTMSEELTMAATDGFRLSVAKRGIDYSIADAAMAIVPARNLATVVQAAKEARRCDLYVTSKDVLFSLDGTDKAGWQRMEVVSELIDARYPDYNATVPKNSTTTASVNTAQLLSAVRVASLFTTEDTGNIIRLTAQPDKPMTIASTNAESGDNVSTVEADIAGDGLEIALNAKYVLDVLNKGELGDTVTLEFTQPTRPMVVRAADGYMHIVMPLHPPRG